MKIKELRNYLNSLPEELDDFDVVYSEAHILDGEKWARKDSPTDSAIVDEHTEELVLGAWKTIDTMVKMTS